MEYQTITDKFLSYLRFAAHEGFFVTLKRVISNLSGIFYQNKILFFYKLILPQVAEQSFEKISIHVSVEEVYPEDIPQLTLAMYQTSQELLQRFKNGKRCFIVKVKQKIGAYLWTAFYDEDIPDVKCIFNTPENSVYIYNVRTKKEYRRQGMCILLLGRVCRIMAAEGVKAAYSTILLNNTGSIHSFERCGFKEIGKVSFKNNYGKTTCIIPPHLPAYEKNKK